MPSTQNPLGFPHSFIFIVCTIEFQILPFRIIFYIHINTLHFYKKLIIYSVDAMYIHLIFYDLFWLATSEFYIYSVYIKCFITTVYTQTIILHSAKQNLSQQHHRILTKVTTIL